MPRVIMGALLPDAGLTPAPTQPMEGFFMHTMRFTTSTAAALAALTLGLTAVHAADQTPTTTTKTATQQHAVIKTTGTVTITKGAPAPLYAKDGDATPMKNRVLAPGTTWRYFAQESYGGYLWINLGGDQWLRSDTPNMQLHSDEKPATPNKPETKPSTSDTSIVQMKGTAKLHAGSSYPVYAHPVYAKPIDGRVLKGASSWKFFAQTTTQGALWLHLGGDQWIKTTGLNNLDITYDKTASQPSTPAPTPTPTPGLPAGSVKGKGAITIKYKPGYGVAVWTQAGGHQVVKGKTLKHGTNWKFFASVTQNGVTWYNLGGNQWIDGRYVALQGTKTAKGRVVVDAYMTIKTNKKKVMVYTDPDSTKTTRSIGINVPLKCYGTVVTDQLWYYIGAGEYIRASDIQQ